MAGEEQSRKVSYFPYLLTVFNDLSRLEVSPSAWVVLDYLIRHTKGWKGQQRFVTLRIQEFIHGRIASNGKPYDNGVAIKAHRTVEEALEELGVKGFIFEIDEGFKDGRMTYTLQDKYWTDDAEEAATLQTTSRYRLIHEGGKYLHKPDEKQQPRYYGQPRKKLTSNNEKGKSSLKSHDHSLKINDPREILTSSPLKNDEQEGHEASAGQGAKRADKKGTASRDTESRIDSSGANAPGARKLAPSSKSLEEQAKEIGDYQAFKYKVRLFYQYQAAVKRAESQGKIDGEAQREYRRLKRELEQEHGFIPPLESLESEDQ